MSSSKSNAVVLTLVMIAMIVGAAMYFLGGEVKSDKYVIRQEFLTGKMSAITDEGWYFKFGYVTEFQISDIIWFSADAEEGRERDESIRVRFNDGASAQISGSVRFILPTDPDELIKLKKQFGNFERIKKELVIQVVNEAIYLTASLMSSKESYTTKRSLFSDYAQDQALNGVFRTRTNEIITRDSISGEVTTRTEIEILRDENTGEILRKESALKDYGVILKNFVVKRIQYPDNILEQLDEQQQALMDVQKAKAMAQKAEQEAITAEKEGLARIAVARAEQEALKVKDVVQAQKVKEVAVLEAEKALAVAKLDRLAAAEYKEAKTMRAEADANAARKLLQADGALKQKLATYQNVMKFWADAYTKQRPTPDIVIGGENKKGSGNAAEQFMNLLSIKALKDLSLDMNVKKK